MGKIEPTSPFARTDFHQLDEDTVYTKEGYITGLQMPDGKILLNFESITSVALVNDMARLLNAKVVSVKGTWTFTPAIEDE